MSPRSTQKLSKDKTSSIIDNCRGMKETKDTEKKEMCSFDYTIFLEMVQIMQSTFFCPMSLLGKATQKSSLDSKSLDCRLSGINSGMESNL